MTATCDGHPVAKDQGHRLAGESTRRDSPVSIDGLENGTVLNPRGVEPNLKRADGAVNGSAADPPADAVLVGLRPPDGLHEVPFSCLEVR
jgi:hypothetical protein